MSRIDQEGVARIARLARLSLSAEEARAMTADLDTMLGYVETLQGLDTEGVPPTSQVATLATPYRADEPAPSLPPERAIANAPASEGSAFAVPEVIGGEEEEG